MKFSFQHTFTREKLLESFCGLESNVKLNSVNKTLSVLLLFSLVFQQGTLDKKTLVKNTLIFFWSAFFGKKIVAFTRNRLLHSPHSSSLPPPSLTLLIPNTPIIRNPNVSNTGYSQFFTKNFYKVF